MAHGSTASGKTGSVYSKPGESRWYPPFKHKVENLGDTPYEAVYVGIKGRTAATANRTGPTLAMAEETRKVVAEYLAAAMKP